MTGSRSLALAVATGLVALVGAVWAPPALATAQKLVSISEDQKVVLVMPAIQGGELGAQGSDSSVGYPSATPSFCTSSPSCDVIPLKVVLPPDYDHDTNDFAVQVRLDWTTTDLPNHQGQANDLDLFIWDQPEGADPVDRSSGGVVPEIAGLAQPEKGNYAIVVRNTTGVNNGYKITVKWINGRLVPQSESQEPEFSAFNEDNGPSAYTPTAAPGTTKSHVPPPAFFPSSLPTSGGGLTSLFTPANDSQLSALGGSSDDALRALLGTNADKAAAGLAAQALFATQATRGTAKAPPGVLLVFWFGFVPLLLLAVGAFLLYRRRPTALSIMVPTGSMTAG